MAGSLTLSVDLIGSAAGLDADGRPDVFTRYVRAVVDGRDDDSAFAEMWKELRGFFIGELRRRSLWTSPPSYLGFFGSGSWQNRGGDDPVHEVLLDGYVEAVLEPWSHLENQVAAGRPIGGLVCTCLRHFVHGRQVKFDPLGSRVFKVVHKAVRQAVAGEELFLLDGAEKIRNDTTLGVTARHHDTEPVAAGILAGLAPAWNDVLLPELVTAEGQGFELVVANLRRFFGTLEAHDVRAFRFRDLVTPLKDDVRRRWTRVGETEDDEDGEKRLVLRTLRPAPGFEEVESFLKLVDCVMERIDEREQDTRRQSQLGKLFRYLHVWALEPDTGKRPSDRKLGELLNISRGAFPALFKILRKMVETCREIFAGKVVDIASHRRGG